jgi:hypothetical protein
MWNVSAAGETISISGGSFPSGAVIVVVVAGALVVVVDVARVVVVGAEVVVVAVEVSAPADVVVSSDPTVVDNAAASTPFVVVVALSAVPNEHPVASTATATTTSFQIPFTPRYYAFPKLATSEHPHNEPCS